MVDDNGGVGQGDRGPTGSARAAALAEFLVRAGVLTFGDFVTKSGRASPYFVDTGRVGSGAQLDAFARFYADTIRERFDGAFDLLFGPAYKGIPLVAAVAVCLARDHGLDVPFCFDRKEAKDHGEGGRLVGTRPRDGDRVLIVEDVTTAGTSIRATVPLLRAAAEVTVAGLVVSVDRQERGRADDAALAELAREFDMEVAAIARIEELLEHLHGRVIDGRVVVDDARRARVRAYLDEHGPRT